MLNSESIVIIQIKGEHLLYSKISGGMIGYGWGNVCYIVFFSPGKYLLYSTVSGGKFYYIANIPRGNVYYSVGRFAMRRFTIRHRHLYFYGVCTKSGKLLVYGPLWFLYLHCWTVVCVVILFVCFLILLEIYLKVKQKKLHRISKQHILSLIQRYRRWGVWASSELATLLSDFQM